MSLLHLALDSISEGDLQRLVDERIPESKNIEYKQALLYVTDEQKREFLSDLTAFANTDGGDLVLGISETEGAAGELVGLNNLIPDEAQGKIENLLRDFVEPRIIGVQMRAVALSLGKHALIIRMPRSFSAPHMVNHRGVSRFCGRNSNGKYDLDVHELRLAFNAGETYAERLRSFRLDRINRLVSGEAPVQLSGDHLLVLHILPLDGVRREGRLQTEELRKADQNFQLKPMNAGGWGQTFNFDGLLVKSSDHDGKSKSYVQLFRKGFIEAVETQLLEPRQMRNDGPKAKIIPSIAWEQKILESLPGYLKSLGSIGIPLPYSLSLSLLNVRGFWMYANPSHFVHYDNVAIDRDHLLTEEVLVESLNEPVEALLRPLFDQVWNACGRSGSINYDDDGKWRPRQ
ncbi:ATP-binding protein [Haloferula sp. BvORR071]|uniref:AlbA family DNA-binding domain-containing protein n=1 Tax=Haloferula sp. BvORR071 TaxID=1396141 RepID=UPI0005557CF0|nr:ATP-binding protein [Haloferula sp. BvORR071]